MKTYLTISRGRDASSARPIFATSERTVVRAVLRALKLLLEDRDESDNVLSIKGGKKQQKRQRESHAWPVEERK